jgi:hypothetical protein
MYIAVWRHCSTWLTCLGCEDIIWMSKADDPAPFAILRADYCSIMRGWLQMMWAILTSKFTQSLTSFVSTPYLILHSLAHSDFIELSTVRDGNTTPRFGHPVVLMSLQLHTLFPIVANVPSMTEILHIRECIQMFSDWVDNKICAYLWYYSLRSNTKGYGGKTH